jgi:hypothetical protein
VRTPNTCITVQAYVIVGSAQRRRVKKVVQYISPNRTVQRRCPDAVRLEVRLHWSMRLDLLAGKRHC